MRLIDKCALTTLLFLASLSAPLRANVSATLPHEHKTSEVKATDVKLRHGGVITCHVTNCLEATVTLTVHLTNMRPVKALPGTFVAGEGTRQWEFLVIDPSKAWKYDYRLRWRAGGQVAHQDTHHAYRLPFPTDMPRKVIQTNFGKHSHGAGSGDEYATDFSMPVGSPVCAARSGLVVAVKQDSDKQGVGPEFSKFGNFVVVRHDDGTFGQYLHLQQNGALVEVGQHVTTGQLIAHSGHTGNSTTPHLHFCVFVNIDGSTKKSLPIRWQTPSGTVDALQQGRAY
jgi:murein DD-endopeptidase MepM/ murein hydrolase activator NlpD